MSHGTNDAIASLTKTFPVPVSLLTEIEEANLPDAARLTILWIAYCCLVSKEECAPIHQRSLDQAFTSTTRRAFTQFIRTSTTMRKANNGHYKVGCQCLNYEITVLRQHHNESVEGCGGLWVGGVKYVTVDFGWYLESLRGAWEILGWDSVRIVMEGLIAADASELTEPEVEALSREESAAEGHSQEKTEARVVNAVAAHRKYLSNDVKARRKDGRTYSVATLMPRWMRRKVVRFGGQAGVVDISACYIWMLAAGVRQKMERAGQDLTEIDRFLGIVESGRFYDEVSLRADMLVEDAKANFNTLCLFGPVGNNPLWWALEDMAPEVCREIKMWRRARGGASRLAKFLMRSEGAIMTDVVARGLAEAGVKNVQVHDAVVVPVEACEYARELVRIGSEHYFGRCCRVKTELFV